MKGNPVMKRPLCLSRSTILLICLAIFSTEAQAERGEELARLLAAVRTLPEREQEIIGLKFLGDLKNRQIGQAMGLRASHVAVILYRAIRRLRDLLEEEERDA